MMMIMMIMLLLLLLLLFPTITYSSTISNPTKWIVHAKGLAPSSSLKDRHHNHNHNNQQHQLWLYYGSLFDPLDGRKIANVQGLELIQIINTNNNNNNNNHTNAKLQIIPLLYTNPNATYTDAVTILSQKVFCYTTTTENSITSEKNKNKNNQNDKKQQQQQQKQILLREIRVRPQSPKKRIPLEQAVSVFETCTTYVSKKKKKVKQQHHNDMMMLMMDNNNNQNDDDEEEDELIIHTEFPKSKQTLWGKATNIKQQSSDNNSLEYTIFTKRRSPTSMLYQPDFTAKTTPSSSSTEILSSSSSTQPKRSQLIQIGPSNNNIETKHKFGARETYSWTNINTLPPPSSSQQQRRRRRWWWKRDTINDHHPSTTTSSSTTNTNTNTNNNARISYTRYGEGPAFYAPGRMCMLELRGKPIQSIDNSTSILQNLIHNHIDGFGGYYLGGGDNNNNNNVVAVFGDDDDRTSSHRSLNSNSNTFLRLKPEPISNQPIWQQRKMQLQKLYFKLQKAITVEHNHHDSYSSSGSNGISQYGVIPR